MAHHVDRYPRLGLPVVISESWYKPTKQPPFTVGLVEAERVLAAAWAHIEDESKDRDPNDESEFQPRQLFRAAWRRGNADQAVRIALHNSLKLRIK